MGHFGSNFGSCFALAFVVVFEAIFKASWRRFGSQVEGQKPRKTWPKKLPKRPRKRRAENLIFAQPSHVFGRFLASTWPPKRLQEASKIASKTTTTARAKQEPNLGPKRPNLAPKIEPKSLPRGVKNQLKFEARRVPRHPSPLTSFWPIWGSILGPKTAQNRVQEAPKKIAHPPFSVFDFKTPPGPPRDPPGTPPRRPRDPPKTPPDPPKTPPGLPKTPRNAPGTPSRRDFGLLWLVLGPSWAALARLRPVLDRSGTSVGEDEADRID